MATTTTLTDKIKKEVSKALKNVLNDEPQVYVKIDEYDTNNNFYTEIEQPDDDYVFEDIDIPQEVVEHEIQENPDIYDDYKTDEEKYEEAHHELLENILMWNTWFSPEIDSIDTALKCNLIPFYHQGNFYLALDSAGMDLSPKLDAYQALTIGSVPSNSKYLTDTNYTNFILGKKLTEEVLNTIRRKSARVTITFDLPSNS